MTYPGPTSPPEAARVPETCRSALRRTRLVLTAAFLLLGLAPFLAATPVGAAAPVERASGKAPAVAAQAPAAAAPGGEASPAEDPAPAREPAAQEKAPKAPRAERKARAAEGGDPKVPGMPGLGADPQPVGGQGWDAFRDWKLIVEIVVVLLLATALAAVIAYHPRTYGKAATLEEVDQPKVFIMYAVVGAVIAECVQAFPIMGVVIFGIGGLLRFRTDVGPARDTGRVILVTIIGLACGLKIYVAAVVATAFSWALIYVLESKATHRVVVKGIEPKLLGEAAEAYEEVLLENGLRILSQKKNFLKGQVAFVLRAPGKLDREELEGLFKDIPPKLQGSADWESS